MNILDAYVLKPPHPQNVLDLFRGEWSTRMPEGSGLHTEPGTAALFDTPHIRRSERLLGGFADKRILELGPLEGAHSAMLQQAGAAEIVAIEANSRSFLKCLCVKEVMGLDRVRYRLGDFMQYLETTEERFDITVASGVLYHMSDPLRLLDLICQRTDHLILWTHYFYSDTIAANPALAPKFAQPQAAEYGGFPYVSVLQRYNAALEWSGFCGGPGETSVWLTRQNILDFLVERGLIHLNVHHEWVAHPNGPSFAVVASRQPLLDPLDGFPDTLTCAGQTLSLSLAAMDAASIQLKVGLLRAETDSPLFVALHAGDELWLLAPDGVLQRFEELDKGGALPTVTLPVEGDQRTLSVSRSAGGHPVSGIYFGLGLSLTTVLDQAQHVYVPL